jgi:hypothetical protein
LDIAEDVELEYDANGGLSVTITAASAIEVIIGAKKMIVGLKMKKAIAAKIRRFAKWRFKRRGLATIQDIPTDEFNELILSLQSEGWEKVFEYAGFDAWIDYGSVRLKKNGVKLKFEWDNWDEGSIEGTAAAITALANRFGYTATDKWRWSSWDQEVT